MLNRGEFTKLMRGGIARLLIGYLDFGIKKIICCNRIRPIHHRNIHFVPSSVMEGALALSESFFAKSLYS